MPDSWMYLSRNDTLRSIKDRRSTRMFSNEPVDDDDLQTILHAANHAPSAHNQQSWKFIVLKGGKKSGLVDLVGTKSAEFTRPSSVLLRMAARSIASAPLVIAVANTGELIKRGGELFKIESGSSRDFFRIMEIQSSAAAVENLLVAATSLDLAAVWLGVLVLIKNDVLRFLGEPEGEFMAIIPVGHAMKQNVAPKKRPLGMVVKHL
ncbi:MAG: nitroreductase family protein [Candidatus Omnitrophica bacterium]|nr:nitroreductase family protein [Candidatus Omnitrophota bacterium]